MSKKVTKSGGLKSIKGGRDGKNPPPTTDGDSKIVDFASIRAQRNLDNRRQVERFFLQHMVDVFVELDGNQQLPIELVEVSETGCSFRLSAERSKSLPRQSPGSTQPIQARFYFSRDSYLKVGLNIINVNPEISTLGSQAVRFGCQIDESFASTEAYVQFVRFIELFAKHCARDAKQVSAF